MADAVVVRELPKWMQPVVAAPALLDLPAVVILDASLGQGPRGRYSYLAADPLLLVQRHDEILSVAHRDGQVGHRDGAAADPWQALSDLLAPYRRPSVPGLPPLQGGVLGYIGYDVGRPTALLPTGPVAREQRAAGGLPDLSLGLYDWVLAYDHHDQRSWLLVDVGIAGGPRAAARRLDAVLQRLPASPPNFAPSSLHTVPPAATLCSTFTPVAYRAAVARAKDYIAAGDIYQVNLSQRLELDLAEGLLPWDLFLRLRRANPIDFGAYVGLGRSAGTAVVCGSPELFLSLDEQGEVETKPMKGTRPRGGDETSDRALAAELLASAKDRAENLMIVDLLRNDLGRVCRVGSIAVPRLWTVESYATVHQLVSTVTGSLRPDYDAVDLLRACFPGGSVTGCPKIRAMQIIDELEPVRRGVYCGTIGYLSVSGAMMTNIVIRTLVISGRRGYLQVGGAIVADSDPAGEYEETLVKARAALSALGAGSLPGVVLSGAAR